MKFGLQKASFVLLVLFSLGLFQLPGGIHQPQSVSRAAVLQQEVAQAEPAAAPKLAAVENYLRRLVSAGCPSTTQGILIQTLDGKVLAEYNAETPLNPASVMKLATSYLALKHFGP